MPQGILKPFKGLNDLIQREPESIEEMTRARKDELQDYLDILNDKLNSNVTLSSTKAAYSLARIYLKCPHTCDYDPAIENRLEKAIDCFIQAMSKANYDPLTVTIPAYKMYNNEIIGPGCRLNYDTFKSFEPMSLQLASELEISQIFIRCIVELNALYNQHLGDDIVSKLFQNKITTLKPLQIAAKTKYLSAQPFSFSLIHLIKLSENNIFELYKIQIDKRNIEKAEKTLISAMLKKDPELMPGALRRQIKPPEQSKEKNGHFPLARAALSNLMGYQ